MTGLPGPTVAVHEIVALQAAATPDALAVVDDSTQLTYGKLNSWAERLAAHLRGLGVGGESVVGLCLARGPRLVVAEFGVLKAGAAFLPIDPHTPADRMRYVLAESATQFLITDGDLPAAGEQTVRAVALDDLPAPADALAGPTPAGGLAYVIYTSGSTGRPKGVMIGHRGLTNLVAWHRAESRLEPGVRTTLVASPGFDVSVWEIWPALAAGATLYVPDFATVLSPPDLRLWLERHRIDVALLPTPIAEGVLALPASSKSSLRIMHAAGDRLCVRPPADAGFVLYNSYGPTENTVISTSGQVLCGEERAGLPSIGKPVSGTSAWVLDAELCLVPPGSQGRLYLGGMGLAWGYLNRPGLTAERFLPDPVSGCHGERLYDSGDLARILPDGSIDFLGRADDQVKISGYRVEPAEVTAALRRHPAVKDACTVTAPSPAGQGTRLIAYLVTAGEEEAADAALNDHLRRFLPPYMMPAGYVRLDALPLNRNGKVNKAALPDPELPQHAAAHREPQSELERRIASIWADVLARSSVGSHDHFFDLGGNSLLLSRVRARIAREFGWRPPLLALFEHSTVSEFAHYLDTAAAASDGPRQPQEGYFDVRQ